MEWLKRELALSEDDRERRTDVLFEYAAGKNWLYDVVDGGAACWDCLSLIERRREASQCEGCGAQYRDDGRESDRGWIVEASVIPSAARCLCPACITGEEDAKDTAQILARGEKGTRFSAAEGKEYPQDFEALAERERGRVDHRRSDLDRLNQATGEE